MASTYTVNLGIEKIGTGEQSGTWGTTTNTNFDLIDQAVNGAVAVTLASAGTSGSPNTLAITNGAASDGRNKFIDFNDGGDLGATAYVQLDPNDAEKIVHMRNSLSGGRSVIVFQGTYNASNDFEIPNGKDVLLKFDGAGASATVTDVFTDLQATAITTPSLTATTADINGGSVDGVTLGTNSAVTEAQIDNININGNTISSTDTDGNVTITPDGTGSVAITKIDVAGGEIDGTAIGANSASTGAFTTLNATGGGALTGTWTDLGSVTTVDINGGTIDGVTIGGSSAGAGSFTTLSASGDLAVDTNTLYVDAANNRVGVGTSSPTYLLNAVAPAGTQAIFQAGQTGISNGYTINSDGTNLTHQWYYGANEAARIDSAGNVGIGTTSIAAGTKLQVAGETRIYPDSGTGVLRFGSGGVEKGKLSVDTSSNMAFETGGSERARIDASGNVGIGSTDAASYGKFLVDGTGNLINANASSGAATFQLYEAGAGRFGITTLNGSAGGAFTTAGTERMRIDSSGNVGIGTSSPTSALDVTGTIKSASATQSTLYLSNAAKTTGFLVGRSLASNDAQDLFIYDVTAASTRLAIDASGNVGIGTSSPATALDVVGTITADGLTVDKTATISTTDYYGSSTFSGVLKGAATNTKAALLLNSISSSGQNALASLHSEPVADFRASLIGTYSADGSGAGYFAINQFIPISSTTAERMRIDSSGNVGIGTSSPSQKLMVEGSAGYLTTIQTSDANKPRLQVYIDDTDGVSLVSGYDTTAKGMQFFTGGANRMRIDASGNVGIGTSSPSYNLQVASAATAATAFFSSTATPAYNSSGYNGSSARLQLVGGSASGAQTGINLSQGGSFELFIGGVQESGGAAAFVVQGYDGSAYTERMRIDASGNVGIGATSPTNKVDILTADNTGLTVRSSNYSGSFVPSSLGGMALVSAGAYPLIFYVNSAERARIDSSGNLLVGRTSVGTTGTGHSIRGGDSAVFARENGEVMIVSRNSSDGELVRFDCNGTAGAGSITAQTGQMAIGSSGTGILFNAGANCFNPFSPSTNSSVDATLDIGKSNFRFKDLYLSGGVYLGGTGAANQLDDYEEGTWTPTYSPQTSAFTSITYDAAVYGKYVKVGAVVHIQGIVRTDAISGGSGSVYIGGMPFTADSYGVISIGYTNGFAGDNPGGLYTATSSTDIIIRYRTTANSGLDNLLDVTDLNTGGNSNYIIFSGTYMTTQ